MRPQHGALAATGVAIALALGACAAVYRPPAGNTAYGPHPFKQVLQNADPPVTLEGTVLILPDTLMLTVDNMSCSADRANHSPAGAFRFDCGEYNFWFSKTNPLRDNSYRVPTIRWQTRRVCAATSVNPTTKVETCSRYEQERVATQVVLSGSLTFIPRS